MRKAWTEHVPRDLVGGRRASGDDESTGRLSLARRRRAASTNGMGSEGELPRKEDVARGLLLRGNLFVHLDPSEDGVILPDSIRNQPQVMLQLGLDMPLPIPDLRVDDVGITGTLSFRRSPFYCVIPWSSVYAICGDDGRGMVWPESMPDELDDEVERELGRKAPPGLRVVDGGGDVWPVSVRSRDHLRVIK